MKQTPNQTAPVHLATVPVHLATVAVAACQAMVDTFYVCLQADCMTSSELASFRKTVRERLEQANKDYGRDVMFRFSEDALSEAHPVHQVPSPHSVHVAAG